MKIYVIKVGKNCSKEMDKDLRLVFKNPKKHGMPGAEFIYLTPYQFKTMLTKEGQAIFKKIKKTKEAKKK